VEVLLSRDILMRDHGFKMLTSAGNITHVSERICEPIESATVKRRDFNVKIDACADKTSRRTGNKENIGMEKRTFPDVLPCQSVSVWHPPPNQTFPY
jgi:hypothetical protein